MRVPPAGPDLTASHAALFIDLAVIDMSRAIFADFTCHFEPGEILFSVGEPGSTLFVVQSGSVELLSEVGKEVLAVMEKGDFFGEMSLLEGSARNLTARAAESADVIEISPALFDRMIRGNIEIAVRMLRKLSLRLSEVERRLALSVRRAAPPEQAAEVPSSDPEPDVNEAGSVSEAPPAQLPAPGGPTIATDGDPQKSDNGSGPGSPAEDTENPAYLVNDAGEKVFALGKGTIHVGRYDPVTGTRPEVDLTLLDLKRSVSRRHAVLSIGDDGCLLTEEVGALNGTSINGQSLTPGEPVPVGDGDELSFGSVVLLFQTAGSGGTRTRSD